MFDNGHWSKSSGNFIFRKCHFQKEMSSWGPGFVQKRGHAILPYYHFVGFGDYASEFFKLVRSIYYAYSSNEFLFIFDKANSASSSFALFESTLKRNSYARYLPYYPSQGFNINERRDLLEPILQQGARPDKMNFFSLFSSVFELQDGIKEKIINVYARKAISPFNYFDVGVCLPEGQTEFSSLIEKLTKFPARPIDPLSIFVSCSTREQYMAFCKQSPSQWTLMSMWEIIPPILVTEEQHLEVLFAFLGSLISLSQCPHLIGSFKHSVFLFMYCKESKFRIPSNITLLDTSSFSYF
jgi:hypothetical protein